MKISFSFLLLLLAPALWAQKTLAPLTVEKIMRDQRWIGTSPSSPYWSADGRYLFFSWNPENNKTDSLYYITLVDRTPRKATLEITQATPSYNSIVYNTPKTAYAYIKDGDLFYVDALQKERRITQTVDNESSAQFINNDKAIVYSRSQNLYAWDIATGLTTQLTNFVKGAAPKETPLTAQEKWLQNGLSGASGRCRPHSAGRCRQ